MKFATLPEALCYLEARAIMPEKAPSLEPMQRALARSSWFQPPDPRRQVILAGTNGKGSTAAALSALIHATGARVGLFTSPHLVSIRERFRVNEADISEPLFLRALDTNISTIEAERLTHFEALTLMAAWIFLSGEAGPPCGWCIWEVGLGGAWDATNAIPHHFCGITRLGFDHESLLGSTLREIALQKFGVIPAGGTVVYSPMEAELALLRGRIAHERGCEWIPALPAAIEGGLLRSAWGTAPFPLAGKRAAENASTALGLAAAMGLEIHAGALARVRWPARFQRIEWKGREVFLSGDHNPQGIESLLEILRSRERRGLRIVVGVCADKESAKMLSLLSTVPHRLYLTETPFRALALAAYPAEFRGRAAGMDPDPARLLDRVVGESEPGDLIVVTGSLYLAGKILAECQRPI
jgi:dihydrofolate synthase/folylpolyglutamate synthase